MQKKGIPKEKKQNCKNNRLITVIRLESRKYGRLHKSGSALLIFLCLAVFLLFMPFTAGIRSLVAASVYDCFCDKQSLPDKLGIKLEMPLQNTDFLPLLLTYNDDMGMSAWLHKPVRFTVDYTVGGFEFLSNHSRFYDIGSTLYNTYTGAYYLQGLGRPADKETILNIAAYDQCCLALPAIGLNTDQAVFEACGIRQYDANEKIAGYDWQCYDAVIITNGPEHTKKSFHTGYILFGEPPPAKTEYPLRQMAGRIYTTYLKDTDLTIGLYIIAKNEDVLTEVNGEILMKIKINKMIE